MVGETAKLPIMKTGAPAAEGVVFMANNLADSAIDDRSKRERRSGRRQSDQAILQATGEADCMVHHQVCR